MRSAPRGLLSYTGADAVWRAVGIVGAEAAKFSPAGEARVRERVRVLLRRPNAVLVSGGCHLGGVDVWAEEEYARLPDRGERPDPIVHLPRVHRWADGYRPRNLLIARDAAELHNIVAARYVEGFAGMRFSTCYHCARRAREHPFWSPVPPHIKSGGCWTALTAEEFGKEVVWHVLEP